MSDRPHRLSNARVEQAGRILRQFACDLEDGKVELGPDGRVNELPPEFVAAVGILDDYRESFTEPTSEIRRKLGPLIGEITPDAQLTGRPKRYERVIGKLVRFPHMRLPQMADISGLRVKFANGPPHVRALLARILEVWPEARVIDYVADPKRTGYRAIHVLISEQERVVELQLRTARQNRWADEVEALDDRHDYGLKDGRGPAELLRYFERAAYKLAVEDDGGTVDEAFERDFAALRGQVRTHFGRRTS